MNEYESDYMAVKLKWGYQVKRYTRYPQYLNEIVIPTLASYCPPGLRTKDVVIPRSLARHLFRELSRILSEPGLNV